MEAKLYVENLSYGICEQGLRELLGGAASFALIVNVAHFREERSGGHCG